jgi:hypothetical protein
MKRRRRNVFKLGRMMSSVMERRIWFRQRCNGEEYTWKARRSCFKVRSARRLYLKFGNCRRSCCGSEE